MAEKTNAIRLLENGNVPFRFYEYDVSDGRIDAIAAAVPGAGRDVMLALCSLIPYDTVSLEVANTNAKALRLYEKLGFLPVGETAKWYQVFPEI